METREQGTVDSMQTEEKEKCRKTIEEMVFFLFLANLQSTLQMEQ
jgi:hypothetical protein